MLVSVREERIATIEVDVGNCDGRDEYLFANDMIAAAYVNGEIDFEPSRCRRFIEICFPGEGYGFGTEFPAESNLFLGEIDSDGRFLPAY